MSYGISYDEQLPAAMDAERMLRDTETLWRNWRERGIYRGEYAEAVERSIITLKALTFAPSGEFAAAATTSLPERIGGVRNCDYRFCWLRDTTFSLLGLIHCGHLDEAAKWMNWLARSTRGQPGFAAHHVRYFRKARAQRVGC